MNNFPKITCALPEESTWTTLSSTRTEIKTLMKTFTLNHVVKSNDESGMSKITIAGLSVGVTTTVCIFVAIPIAVRRNRKQSEYNSLE